MGTGSKFWKFISNKENPEDVELRIDGEIVDDDKIWLYEWFGVPATSPNIFRSELKEHAGKNLTVWIDSWGGDCTAAAGIYNALKEHDGRVVVKVDGKAVSAGSIISMAGDEVFMSPVGIMMIHNPWTQMIGEAKDMNHAADVLNEFKDALITAYQIKTRRSRAKISKMMDDETWMSAKKALAEGFIDGILYSDGQQEATAEEVGNSFMFNRAAIQNSATASARRFIEQHQKLQEPKYNTGQPAGLSFAQNTQLSQEPVSEPQPAQIKNKEGDVAVETKTVEELKQNFPDLCSQLENAAREAGKAEGVKEGIENGAKEERERIQAIDEIANTVAPELVIKAKYEKFMTAEQLAFQSLKNDAAKGRQYLEATAQDSAGSGVNNVASQPQNQQGAKGKEEEERKALAASIAGFINKRRVK